MDIKKRTLEEVADRIEELERIISKKGVGSNYLKKAERTQRNVNIALLVGATAIVGVTAWAVFNSD